MRAMQRTSTTSRATLLAVAALGMMAIPATQPGEPARESSARSSCTSAQQPKVLTTSVKSTQALKAAWASLRSTRRPPGYPRRGWSVRQGQRMARKARNVARNRRAHRG